jgi:hypothetical protein
MRSQNSFHFTPPTHPSETNSPLRAFFSNSNYSHIHVETAKRELDTERANPTYARRREADVRRRDTAQAAYVAKFAAEVRAFLDFAPPFAEQARKLAEAVTAQATPVGSPDEAHRRRAAG